MIPKVSKPKILDHRPIAVTVNSSKLICSILRKKIEEHLKDNNIIFEKSIWVHERRKNLTLPVHIGLHC